MPTTNPSPPGSLEVILTEDGGHCYTVDGKRVPGVSEIIQGAGYVDYDGIDPATLERVAALGRDVHMACADLDLGKADWWSDDAEIGPRVAAYELFKKEHDFQPVIIEEPMFQSEFRFAGCPDRYGSIAIKGPWARDNVRGALVLDLKRVWELRDHMYIQLAGYGLLVESHLKLHPELKCGSHEDPLLWALRLKPDGTYKIGASLLPVDDMCDFLAGLRVYLRKTKKEKQ